MEQSWTGTARKADEIGTLIQSLSPTDWQKGTTVKVENFTTTGFLTLSSERIQNGRVDPDLPTVVIVDKGQHRTHVLQMKNDGRVDDVLTVPNAVGKAGTPTPSKRWEVSDKRLDPIWYPPKSIGGGPVAPFKDNPRNPIGLAFIRLDGSNYGLHGTNRPDQIGRSVSHGCMRHNNEDILKIYSLVKPGTAVYTVNRFDGSQVRVSDFRKQ